MPSQFANAASRAAHLPQAAMNCEATVCLPDLRLAMLLRLFFVMTDYYKLCNAHVPSLLLVKFLFVACYDSKGLMALEACYTLLSSLGSHNFTETAACTSSCCCLHKQLYLNHKDNVQNTSQHCAKPSLPVLLLPPL